MKNYKIAVLASGSGHVLKALVEAKIPVALVICDRVCEAMKIASEWEIPYLFIQRSYTEEFNRDAYTSRIKNLLRRFRADLVIMTEFKTALSHTIFDHFEGKILTSYAETPEEFLSQKADLLEGPTIRRAVSNSEQGPIIARFSTPIGPEDTQQSLLEKIRQQESRFYPHVIQGYLSRLSTS